MKYLSLYSANRDSPLGSKSAERIGCELDEKEETQSKLVRSYRYTPPPAVVTAMRNSIGLNDSEEGWLS
jgi:hypothetical protein